MATPEVCRRAEGATGDQRRLRREVRLPRRRELPLQGAEGPDARDRREDLRVQVRAAVDARLPAKALDHFLARPMPTWGGPLLAGVDFDNIHYFMRASERAERSWDEVPADVKKTFDRLGIPEAERKFLAGVGAQYESRGRLPPGARGPRAAGRGLPRHGHGRCASTRTSCASTSGRSSRRTTTSSPRSTRAVWSGGSFIYVPPGVHVEMPLQAYFRINTENMGQFERTLIIADEGSYVHYVEGCTAPTYSTDSLHSAVVELIAQAGRADPLHDDPELVARTSTTSSPSAPSRTRTRPSSGSTATSARS